jgi:autotransporter-associated beta strand protein
VVSTSAVSAWAIISSNAGLDISQVIGANAFYSNGFTGGGATIANIEAGYIWDGQQTLTQDTVEFSDSSISGQFDMHATWVGSALNGQGSTTEDRGIAYGSTVWSGAIATSWNSSGSGQYSGSFNFSTASFTTPYLEAMVTGVVGSQTADVINSSFATDSDENGLDYLDLLLDSLINESGKTVVMSAGNFGPGTNTVGSPESGINTLVVGALTGDQTSPVYGSIFSASSRSPSDIYVPTDASGSTGSTISGARALVDITAPGADLTLAHYGGATGGNTFGGPTDTYTNAFNTDLAGTSFAAPIVAASAALIVGAGKTLYPSDSNAIDGRIVKAVLMNSATKPAGWNNGQSTVGGVVTTTQSLDETYGAGILNMTAAYSQYTGGTTDLSTSLSDGGTATVKPNGWAFGKITHQTSSTATEDYLFNSSLKAGSTLNVTLDWFADETSNAQGGDPLYGSFDNLDLQVYLTSGGSPTSLVAQSTSQYTANQELSFALPSTGTYLVQVSESGYVWNCNGSTTTPYGLAWSGMGILSATWANAKGASWSAASNWSTGVVPNSAGVVADLFGAIGSPQTLTLDGSITVGDLDINSSNAYTLAPGNGGTLTLDNAGTAAVIVASGANHVISAPVTLTSYGVNVTVGAANDLTISGAISGSGSLTSQGSGTLTLSGNNSYGATTVSAGKLIIGANGALPANSNVTLGASSTLQLASNTGGETLSSLSIANTTGGTLDITNNHFIINYGSSDPKATILQYLSTGSNGGAWNGTGIVSSAANSNYGVAFADGADGVDTNLTSGQIEVAYALYGDITLQGLVDSQDFHILATNFGRIVTGGWEDGDFYYSGTVNAQDFQLLADNFGKIAMGADVSIQASDWSALDAFAAANGLSVEVPEPAAGAVLVLGIAGALRGRRRRGLHRGDD